MKQANLLAIALWLTALTAFMACAADDVAALHADAGATLLELRIKLPSDRVRAVADGTTQGTDSLNENLIKRLDIYLFAEEDRSSTAVVHVPVADVQADGEYTLVKNLTLGQLHRLFPDSPEHRLLTGESCLACVVANMPADVQASLPDLPTLAMLSDCRTSNPSFGAPGVAGVDAGGNVCYIVNPQECFVMTGRRMLTLGVDDGTYRLRGDVDLCRTAAKIDLVITNVLSSVKDAAGNTWTPLTERMHVGFYNGVLASMLDPEGGGYMALEDKDYFDLPHNEPDKRRPMNPLRVDDTTTCYVHDVPFYTYASHFGEASSPHYPYLTLMVPWQMATAPGEAPVIQDTYYQIPIRNDSDFSAFTRNTYYRVLVNVGIIGGLDESGPVTLDDNTYMVMAWAASMLLPVNMRDIRFLTVAYNAWTLNNETQGGVEYASSHSIDVDSTFVRRVEFLDYEKTYIRKAVIEASAVASANHPATIRYYRMADGGWVRDNDSDDKAAGDDALSTYGLSYENRTVTLSHELTADMLSPRVVTVNVSNGLPDVADQEIVFTQYPPIYIDGRHSNGKVFVNSKTYDENDRQGTYNTYYYTRVYDDNNSTYIGGVPDPSSIRDLATQANNNGHLYTVFISALGDDTYTIGDPRDVPQVMANIAGTVKDGDGVYRPARSTDEVRNMLTPAIVIGSSYGKGCQAISYEAAKKRCSAYQEDGHPQGRWRLPTEGEIEFIVRLSNQNKIPSLFSTSNGRYWASSGRAYSTSWAQSAEAFVRCVYDVWRWGDERVSPDAPVWSKDIE